MEAEAGAGVQERSERSAGGRPRGAHPEARAEALHHRLVERRDGGEAVHRAALEDGDEDLAPAVGAGGGGGERGALEEQRPGPRGEEGDAAGFQEDSTCPHGWFSWVKMGPLGS